MGGRLVVVLVVERVAGPQVAVDDKENEAIGQRRPCQLVKGFQNLEDLIEAHVAISRLDAHLGQDSARLIHGLASLDIGAHVDDSLVQDQKLIILVSIRVSGLVWLSLLVLFLGLLFFLDLVVDTVQ